MKGRARPGVFLSDGRAGNGKGKVAVGQGKGRAFKVTDTFLLIELDITR
jgi:hypothetical protein